MIKRKVFLLLSAISFIFLFTIGILLPGISLFGGIATGFFWYIITLFISLLISIIYEEKYNRKIGIPSLIFPFGFITLNYKKIYYSDLGYFWARLHKDKIYIYEQHYFFTEMLFFVYYEENFDSLSNEIKYKLGKRFEEKININKTKTNFKSWDGYIDKKSKREDKIDQII